MFEPPLPGLAGEVATVYLQMDWKGCVTMSRLRDWILRLRIAYLRCLGIDIDRSARISMGAFLDRTNPKGIHIGAETFVARGAVILSHDFTRKVHAIHLLGSAVLSE